MLGSTCFVWQVDTSFFLTYTNLICPAETRTLDPMPPSTQAGNLASVALSLALQKLKIFLIERIHH